MTAFASRCFPTTVKIPAHLRDRPLEALPGSRRISTRLAHVLHRSGIRMLGDLDRRRVGDFAWERNCGLKTLKELDSLASTFANQPSSRNVVRSVGLRTVGNLHGRNSFELLQWKSCGWRTLAEIQQLIDHAIAGEFDVAQIDESRAAEELLTLLEQGIAKLAPRDRQFLLARIGGRTFAEIGRRYGFTRACAHKMVARTLGALRKTWGVRIPRLLQVVKRRCLSIPVGSGLTPALLEQWTAGSTNSFRLSRKEQMRLIAALDKSIRCSVD
jgi:hypothetical protein